MRVTSDTERANREERRSQQETFHRISGSRAFDEIVGQISFAIRSGIYQAGDRLPTVDVLARTMGVSKPTIGNAIRILDAAGVIKPQRGAGGGLVVLTNDIPLGILGLDPVAQDSVGLAELLEARRPIEMRIAELAAERATDSDFRLLQASIEQLRDARGSNDILAWVNADHLFHYTMGRAARNGQLSQFQHQVLERLVLLLDNYSSEFDDPSWTITIHTETFEALRSRDRSIVLEVMNRHLEPLERAASRLAPA